jgi:hypothetical protein
MDQHRLAGLDTGAALDERPGGQALEQCCRGGFGIERVRQEKAADCIGDDMGCIAAALGEICDPVARCEIGDAFTHRLDDSRTLGPHQDWGGGRIKTGAIIDIDEIDADGLVADAQLAHAWGGKFDILAFDGIDTAWLADDQPPGVAHASVSAKKAAVRASASSAPVSSRRLLISAAKP